MFCEHLSGTCSTVHMAVHHWLNVTPRTVMGSASMSLRSAKRGVPEPRVATMPVRATGYLKGMSSAFSCCRRYALVRSSSNASSGMRCSVLRHSDYRGMLVNFDSHSPRDVVCSCTRHLQPYFETG